MAGFFRKSKTIKGKKKEKLDTMKVTELNVFFNL